MDLSLARTPRLALTRPQPADLEDLGAMWSDPAVWEHFPSLSHTDRATSEASLTKGVQAWQRDDLGWWVARSAAPGDRDADPSAGALIGNGGCSLRAALVWNLGYRLGQVHGGGVRRRRVIFG